MKNEFDYLNEVSMDFSQYDIEELTDKERKRMKRANKKHTSSVKLLSLSAAVIAAVLLCQSALAGDLYGRIVKSVSTGHNSFTQIDMSGERAAIPEEYKGYLYDKYGNVATIYTDDTEYYDKHGNKIENVSEYLSENIPSLKTGKSEQNDDPLQDARDLGYPVITDISKIDDYLCFKSLLPEYLPEGYNFYGASAYGNEYLFVYYKKGNDYIMLHERIINDETSFEDGTDGKLEEVKINGVDAVIVDRKYIGWEQGNVFVEVNFCNTKQDKKSQLVKIAKSIIG